MATTRKLSDVIVSRRLAVAGRPRRFLTVRFERPRRSGRDWVCWFELRGLGARALYRTFGVDSLQALTLGIEVARVLVERRRLKLTGTFDDKRGGLPRVVLTPLSRVENEEIHRALDRITDRLVRRRIRRGKRRGKAAG